jgi:cell wall-associated NlpC family hydrolase
MTNWSPEQIANARMIMAVGQEMGMSSRDIMTGIITAMQESSLRNLGGGDRDSAGLFQQRPSQGWGSYSQVTDPLYATRKFFGALKGVSNRGGMQIWQAAQAVQRSAYPFAYAAWENDAKRMMLASGMSGGLPYPVNTPDAPLSDQIGPGRSQTAVQSPEGSTPAVSGSTTDKASPTATGAGASTSDLVAPGQVPKAADPGALDKLMAGMPGLSNIANGARQIVLNAAQRMIGTPYLWGGGNAQGATYGSAHGYTGTGMDCSGLVLYAYAQAGIQMPHFALSQAQMGKEVPVNQLQPGDLVGFGSDVHHIGIYIGGGQMIEAPYTGSHVRIGNISDHQNARGFAMPLTGNAGTPGATDYNSASHGDGGGQVTTAAQKIAIATADATKQENAVAPMTPTPEGIGAPQAPTPLVNFPGLIPSGNQF